MKIDISKKRKGLLFLGVASMAMGLTIVDVQSATYADMPYTGPTPMPAFPAGFSAFNPPVTNLVPAADAPAIAEWTRQNQPGDTMALTGENFSLHTGVAEGRDTRFILYGEGVAAVDGLIQRLDGRQCALTLPTSLPSDEMYLLWPCNEAGYGKPVAINRTEAWWVGPDKVSRGEVFSINGRNLSLGAGSTYLWIEENNLWITNYSGNEYHAEFTVPDGLENGTYTLWAHNGKGREYGWSKAVQIAVQDRVAWNGATVNIVADFGAVGDGITDDTAAINNALAAVASLSRPTVYFPAGTYAISSSITAARNDMRLLGENMANTKITSHPNFSGTKLFSISGQTEPLAFVNLTIDSGTHMSDVTPLFEMRNASNVTFDNVHLTTLSHPDHNYDAYNGLEFYGAKYFSFKNCKFTLGHLVNLKGSKQCVITNCDFYGIVDNQLFINAGASDQMTVVDCTAQNYDMNSSWGMCQGRFFYARQSDGRLADVYFAGNETVDLTVRAEFTQNQNTGEQYMHEFGETRFRDYPTAATSNTVRFSDITSTFDRMTIAIIEGKGQGQYRDVLTADTGTDVVTVADDWNVMPDASSLIVIGTYPARHVVWNNIFDGVERAVTTDVPSTAGVMPYGSQFDMVVADNYFHQLKHGISLWEIQNTLGAVEVNRPLFFNLFKDNTLHRVRRAIDINLPKYSGGPAVWDTCLLGNVFRNNVISNTTEDVIRHRTWDSSYEIDLMVYDGNTVSVWERNFIDRASENYRAIQNNQIYVGNTFSASGGNGIQIQSTDTPAFNENTWTGFTKIYAGSPSGSLLELPCRVATLDPQSLTGETTLLNAGTAVLNWTANTTSSWLNITQAGTIADENSLGALVVQVDEENVPITKSTAIIEVTSDAGQKQQITVEYEATSPLPPPPDPPPAPVLTGISISGPVSVDEKTPAQYVCTASYSDGSTAQVAPVWSENSASATIDGSGVLSAGDVNADENVTVTASYGGYSDTHAITIIYIPVVLTGISISGPSSVNEETSAQYTCTASYSDGTSVVVAPNWNENSAYATINNSGVLTAGNVSSDQNVTVAASFEGQTDTHAVTIAYVPPVLLGITISGPSSVEEEKTAQYTCTASYSDGTSAAVVPNWSENSAYASISASGLLSAGNVSSDQNVTVAASFGGQTDTHAVTIVYVPPVLTGIAISGPSSLDEETTATYTCTASYSDGTSVVVTPSWSENSAHASISASGLLSAGDVASDQSATVTAAFGGQTDTHAVTINYVAPPIVLTSLSIAGPDAIEENSTAQYVCTAHYSDGSSAQVNPSWSENSSFASIDGAGLLTTGNVEGDEQVTLQASFEGEVITKALLVAVIGDQAVLQLSGFDGKMVSAELWDAVGQTNIMLGEEFEPEELVIENVNPDQWYWLGLREYDALTGQWVLVHGRWIWM